MNKSNGYRIEFSDVVAEFKEVLGNKVGVLNRSVNLSAYILRDELDTDTISQDERTILSHNLDELNSLRAQLLILSAVIEPDDFEVFENSYNETLNRR